MIRMALLLGVLAAPAAAQTALGDRPGHWIAMPRTGAAAQPAADRPETGDVAVIAAAEPLIARLVTPGEAPSAEARPAPRPALVEPADIAALGPEPTPRPQPVTARVPVAPAVPQLAVAAPEPGLPPRAAAGPEIILRAAFDAPHAALQPARVALPTGDPAPLLSRPRPPAPAALDLVDAPAPGRPARLAAVRLPAHGRMPPPEARLSRVAMPRPDPFPWSALPPGALPEGPPSLSRTTPPPEPATEPMAGVMLFTRAAAPAPRTVPPAPAFPARDAAPADPEAPLLLPLPDPTALARMVEEAEVCWRFADLSHDASWARLTVEVALDETNMPAGRSLRLTGFSGALSGVAEEAYRAVQAALAGCASATGSAPATRPARLQFDRNGVHLR